MICIQTTERWNKSRLSSLFIENSTKNSAFDEQKAYQFFFGSIIPKKEYDFTEDLIETYRKYTIVQPGDIIINGLNLNYDFVTQRVGLVKEKGIITSAYLSLRPRKDLNTQYYCYLLKTVDAQKMFHGLGTGIRLTLSYKDIKNLMLPAPTRDEQDQIVRFLDWKVSEINRLINAKRKEIKKLEELKITMINNAVTRGLDQNVETKSSGVKWLGDIPAHWNIQKIKHVLVTHFGGCWGVDAANNENDLLCVRIADFDFSNQTIKETANTKRNYTLSQIEKGHLEDGDLILEKSGGGDKTPVGRVVRFSGTCGQAIMFANFSECLRPNKRIINSNYLAFCLKSVYYAAGIKKYIKQTTGIQNIDIDSFLSICIALPPRDEQDKIVDFLIKKTHEINCLINTKTKEISAFEEMKNSFIADVVTGKIDVRDVEIPAYELVDEDVDMGEADEDFEQDGSEDNEE